MKSICETCLKKDYCPIRDYSKKLKFCSHYKIDKCLQEELNDLKNN